MAWAVRADGVTVGWAEAYGGWLGMLSTIEGGCWVDCGVSWKWAVMRGCCGGTGVWMDGVTPMMGDCAVTLWLKEGG